MRATIREDRIGRQAFHHGVLLEVDTQSWTWTVLYGGDLRRSKFTESQIVAALREVEGGVPIAEVIASVAALVAEMP